MSREELIQLADTPVIDIGAHTMTHQLLSTLSPDEQYDEINGSRQWLEEVLAQPVISFAYPSGIYNGDTVGAVRAAGFSAACTVEQGCVQVGDDLFQLRRCNVADWDEKTFKQNLEYFFSG
jgi:peptidoglycan/xylan/chitin deacetylase (PgdA/CDA1 family)